MEDNFSATLNGLLLSAFQSILKIEAKMLSGMGQVNLSISEVHLLEAVAGAGEAGTQVCVLAQALELSPPSVTVAVKKLEGKGMLQKVRGKTDGRTVSITLTPLGAKVERVHRRFHESMVRGIASDMSEGEKDVLLMAMRKLNTYFDRRMTPQAAEEARAEREDELA